MFVPKIVVPESTSPRYHQVIIALELSKLLKCSEESTFERKTMHFKHEPETAKAKDTLRASF